MRLTGTVVRKDCTLYSGTGCVPCDPGTFMDRPNGLNKCFLCTSCDQVHGLFAKKNCTETHDAVCDVLRGYYCRSLADHDGCSSAERHLKCSPGQRIKSPGTSRSDTVCEGCSPGYFSKDGVNCTAWTICSENQVKEEEGSLITDTVCSSASRHHYTLIGSFVVLVICSIFVATLARAKSRETRND
ncbi:tumor necrosis factor receptor superfamily member 14 isoform X2 [Mugil cephalus]|uniref:tumor necrosis factor receptor superfamily member 14 isoform X2 n=1 Tax=Mugil cephalus TaxID=48193 RepID=UPI001FB7D8F5|nr:tumor necrosis factor receptor superfamily member 14 isoform X2 [Mugil cephalus]